MHRFTQGIVSLLGSILFGSCQFSGTTQYENTHDSFLKDIRPRYFKALDFDNATVRSETGEFENNFAEIYATHEAEFKRGDYKTKLDSLSFGLECFYFGFLVAGNSTAVMDGVLPMADLAKNNRKYFKHGKGGGSENEELVARMERSVEILALSAQLRKEDRRAKSAYWNARVYSDRLKSANRQVQSTTVSGIVNFAIETGVDRTTGAIFPNYDLLLTLITTRLNEDSLFTFASAEMDTLASHAQNRLNPAAFLGLSDLSEQEIAQFSYVGILGPIYRMDILLRKASWMLKQDQPNFEAMRKTLAVVESTSVFLKGRLKPLVDRWPHKSTVLDRQVLLARMQEFAAANLTNGGKALSADAESFFKKTETRQAYQCYNCHRKDGY